MEVLRVSAKAGAVTDIEAVNGDVFLTTHKDGAVQLIDSRSGDTSRLASLSSAVTSVSHDGFVSYLTCEGGQLGCLDLRILEKPIQFTVTPNPGNRPSGEVCEIPGKHTCSGVSKWRRAGVCCA